MFFILRISRDFNPSAAGARDLRLLQIATKTLQLEQEEFFGFLEGNGNYIAKIWSLNSFYIYKYNKKATFGL